MTEALKTILNYPRSLDFPSCWAEAELRLAAAGVDFTSETIREMRMISQMSPMTAKFFENLFIAFVKSAAFTKDFIPGALNWIFLPVNLDPTYYDEEFNMFEHVFILKYSIPGSCPGSWDDDIFSTNYSREKILLAIKMLVMNRSIELSPKTCFIYIATHEFLACRESFFYQLLSKKFLEIGKPDVADTILKAVQDSAKNEMFLK